MKIKDIIEEKYKVARKYYETSEHTPKCSYCMGYMDALGELLEKIKLEEEKKIPEKIDNSYYHLGQDQQNQLFKNTINEILDYLKSKGE